MSLAVLPDRRVLHTARDGRGPPLRPADAAQHARRRRRRLPARRGRPPGHRAGPELRATTAGSTCTTRRRGDTPEDDPLDAGRQRGRRAVRRATTRATSTSSRARCASRASSSRRGKLNLDTEQKIIDVPVDRGICCHVGGQIDVRSAGQPVPVHGRRLEPVRVRRLHADRRAARAATRRSTPSARRQHERPARQAAAHPAEGQRRLRHPAGQPVPARHAEDQARDLPDGPAQPVPLRRQRRRRATSTWRTTRRTPSTRPIRTRGPAGPRALDADPQAGQLRLALLRHAGHPVHRLRLRDGDVG